MRHTTAWIPASVCVAMIVGASVAGSAEPADIYRSSPNTVADLQVEIERIAQTVDGIVGITAYHIESGQRVSVRGTEPFPMASVYKIPIAIQYLARVDRGEMSLDQLITITAAELRPGRSVLPGLMQNGIVTLPARQLLRLMIAKSDNTSSDFILRLAGGASDLSGLMRQLCVGNVPR